LTLAVVPVAGITFRARTGSAVALAPYLEIVSSGCLGKYLLKQNRFLLAPELEVESDAGKPRHGNFKFDGLDLMLVEPDPHFVHGLGERVFGLFDADRKGGIKRHLTLLSMP
jgi:hypothetical protein